MICDNPICENTFEASLHKRFCSRRCQAHSARTRVRAERVTEFVAVDGEGQTVNGVHNYVLLTVGDTSFHDHGQALRYQDIFSFLWGEYEGNPGATFVGFYLGYDFTQWLKGLPEERARRLVTKEGKASRERRASGGNRIPFPVQVGQWDIDILGMKRFKLRPRGAKTWMFICDAGSFFQCSLVNAINPARWAGKPVVSDEEYRVVVEGKANRSTAVFGKEMIEYNLLENVILRRLMGRLNEGFVAAGIRLDRDQWMGPGQASQKWMNNVRCPTGEQIRESVPEWARKAARESYYGGWFELFAHGHVPGETYGYDLNSAYPFIISRLPCLLHGKWEHGTGEFGERGHWHLVKALVMGRDSRCGAMLHRDKNGRISRPSKTGGWYWWPEVCAAREAGIIETVEIIEWVNYEPCGCEPPLAEIREMYQRRLDVGKNSSRGNAYKLVYNSAYGKLAQSIGQPKYSNPIWASLITSGCRTLILEAIGKHPRKTRDLLMIATDGVYFTSPHADLELSPDKLGKWDEECKTNMTLFVPGMYWDDKTRRGIAEGKTPVLKSRGVNANDLAKFIEDIDRQFATWKPEEDWPSVDITIRFNMVSMGQALNRGKWELCGTVSNGDSRRLNSYCGSKREPWSVYRDNGVYRSYPYTEMEELWSKPYERLFGDELDIDTIMDDNGELPMLIAEALREAGNVDVPTVKE